MFLVSYECGHLVSCKVVDSMLFVVNLRILLSHILLSLAIAAVAGAILKRTPAVKLPSLNCPILPTMQKVPVTVGKVVLR